MASKLGIVIGLVAVVLVVVGLIGPWWVVDTSGQIGGLTATSHAEYSMFGRTENAQSGTTQNRTSSSTNTTAYSSLPQTGSVFGLALILTVLGLILGIGAVAIGVLPSANSSFRRFAVIAGALAFVLLLIAALYAMSSLPAAVSQDSHLSASNAYSGFWGTRSSNFSLFGITISGTVNWAGGWAWYVVLIAAILFLVAGITLVAPRKAAPMLPSVPPP